GRAPCHPCRDRDPSSQNNSDAPVVRVPVPAFARARDSSGYPDTDRLERSPIQTSACRTRMGGRPSARRLQTFSSFAFGLPSFQLPRVKRLKLQWGRKAIHQRTRNNSNQSPHFASFRVNSWIAFSPKVRRQAQAARFCFFNVSMLFDRILSSDAGRRLLFTRRSFGARPLAFFSTNSITRW